MHHADVRVCLAVSFFCLSALAAAVPAAAHIGVTPGLVRAGGSETLKLSVHNDLDRPMTGLSVAMPNGIRIVGTGGDWEAVVENETATWSGGSLAPNTGGAFEIELAVDPSTPVGPVQLDAAQLYPNGGSLPWPIPLTVIPDAAAETSSNTTTIVALALLGFLVVGSIGALAFVKRRRAGTLQER